MGKKSSANGHSLFSKKYRHRGKPGARPGTLRIPEGAIPPTIRVTCYGPGEMEDHENCDVARVTELLGKHPVTWIDIVGLGDVEVISEIGTAFGFHRLALEDAVSIPQRSKSEQFHDHLFLIAQFPSPGKKHKVEQVSFFLGKNYIISWREKSGDCFDTVRHRLQFTGRAMRDLGPDYMQYALLDALIDTYFPTLEKLGDIIDKLDVEMESGTSSTTISRIHAVRHDLRIVRRIVRPLREVVDSLITRHQEFIGNEVSIYFRDCHDHIVQIMDTLENNRDACSDLRDFYANQVSIRMNEVIKVLTIISTIFIPLSFVAGIYGMNFDPEVSRWNMPELSWPFGYPLIMGLMTTIACGQLFFFYRKGWLGAISSGNPQEKD